MDNNFERCFKKTLKKEGGYVNDPNDSGGATRYGITEAVAREHNYEGDMRDLPIELAKEIYFKDYWNALRLSEIKSEMLQEKLFDAGVNVGIKRVAKWLQECVNAFPLDGDERLVVDGKIGVKTTMVVNRLTSGNKKDEVSLVKLINCKQGNHYVITCTRYPKNRKFLRGWTTKRINL